MFGCFVLFGYLNVVLLLLVILVWLDWFWWLVSCCLGCVSVWLLEWLMCFRVGIRLGLCAWGLYCLSIVFVFADFSVVDVTFWLWLVICYVGFVFYVWFLVSCFVFDFRLISLCFVLRWGLGFFCLLSVYLYVLLMVVLLWVLYGLWLLELNTLFYVVYIT